MYGLWDSIRGMTLVLHIDDEVNRQNAELELRQKDRYERAKRSPSPVPSSAAAMIREEYAKRAEENSDERSLQKMLNKKPAVKEQHPQGYVSNNMGLLNSNQFYALVAAKRR